MDPTFLELLRRQHTAGFPDVAGANLAATLPITDRLLNELVARYLPSEGRIRTLEIRALAGDQIGVRVSLAKPRFLPPFNLTMSIDRQPELPASPELVLKIVSGGGLMALAGPVTAMLDVLPPGVQIVADRIHLDLSVLLRARGLDAALLFLEELRVNTSEGTVVVSVKARIPSKP